MKPMLTLALATLLFSCTSIPAKTEKPQTVYSWQADYSKDVVKVLEGPSTLPEWVGKEPAVGCYEGKSVIFFNAYGTDEMLKYAKLNAELNAAVNAAETIKFFSIFEFQTIVDRIDTSEVQREVSDILQLHEAISAKNIDVNTIYQNKFYYRKVLLINNKEIYQVFSQNGIPFTTYLAKRDGMLNPQRKERKFSKKQQEFYSELEKEMENLDKTLQKQACP